MKPLRLTIKNFGPYLEEKTIDFTKLGPVYVIIGDTGDGKSTIYEAIQIACFGDASKINKSRSAKLSSYINDSSGAKTFFIRYEFMSGGGRYMIERELGSCKLSEYNEELKKWSRYNSGDMSKTEKMGDIKESIEEVIGYDFKIFNNIEFVPQLSLSTILKPVEPKDRRNMILTLAKCDPYKAFLEYVKKKLAETKVEYALKEAEYEGLMAKESELKELRVALGDKQAAAESLLLSSTDGGIEGLKRAGVIVEKLREMPSVDLPYPDISKKDFMGILGDVGAISMDIVDVDPNSISEEISSKGDELIKLSKEVDSRHTLIGSLRDKLEAFVKIRDDHLSEMMSEEEKIDKEYAQIQYLTQSIDKVDLSFFTDIPKLNNISVSQLRVAIEYRRINERNIQYIARINKGKEELLLDESEVARIYKQGVGMKKEIASCKGILTDLQQRKAAVEATNHADHLKSYIINNDIKDCPVCKSKIDGDMGLSDCGDLLGISKEIAIMERKITDLNEEIVGLRVEYATKKEKIDGSKRSIEHFEGEIVDVAKPSCSFEGDDIDGLISTLKEKEKYEEDRVRYNQIVVQLKEMKESKENMGAAFEERKASYLSKMKDLRLKSSNNNRASSIIVQNISAAESELSESNLRAIFVDGEIVRVNLELKTLEDNLARVAKNNEAIDKIMVALGERVRGDIFKNVRLMRESIESISQRDSLISELTELKKLIKIDDGLIKQRVFNIEELRSEASEIGQRASVIEEETSRSAEALGVVRGINNKLKALDGIRGDFSNDKMMQYLESLFLPEILDKSSEFLLHMTSGKYEFNFNVETGDILIQNNLKGTERQVHTFSGGELFQASLALILGLRNVSWMPSNLETLIIDEGGFSALDSGASLNMAIESIEMVSAMCPTVQIGIITHVKEIADRFSPKIKIKSLPNGDREIKIVD